MEKYLKMCEDASISSSVLSGCTTPLPCIDDLNSYQMCLNTLKAKCPNGLMVKHLIGMKASGRRETCMWVASYSKENNLPIPRIEAKQMIGLLQRSGCPEDGLLKIVGHSRLSNFECIFGEWRKTNCKCGSIRLYGDNSDVPKHKTTVIQEYGPVNMPLYEFSTPNSQTGCVADLSSYPSVNDNNLMGFMALMACCQWEMAVIAGDITHLFFIGRVVESNVIVIGGVSNHLMLLEYMSKMLGCCDESNQAEICFWVDDDLLDIVEVYGESKDALELLPTISTVSIGNQHLKNLLISFSAAEGKEKYPNDSNEEEH